MGESSSCPCGQKQPLAPNFGTFIALRDASCSQLHGGMLLGQVVSVASEKASTAF